MTIERWALTTVVVGALACGASAPGGGGGLGSDAGFSMNQGDTGSGSNQCSASCALLVPCLGSTVGSMGECVSECQAAAVPAACHSCVQSACTTCGMACGQCFAMPACQGMSAPTDAGTRGGAIGPQCQGCVIGGSCGAAVSACAGDSTCAACLTNYNNPACGSNPAFINLASCACTTCGSDCASECSDFGL